VAVRPLTANDLVGKSDVEIREAIGERFRRPGYVDGENVAIVYRGAENLAAFITNIAESDFRYTQGLAMADLTRSGAGKASETFPRCGESLGVKAA
jgi:hypothetical protein